MEFQCSFNEVSMNAHLSVSSPRQTPHAPGWWRSMSPETFFTRRLRT